VKNLIFLVLLSLLASCAGMKKQANIVKAMDSYKFKQTSSNVYKAAAKSMSQKYVTINKVKKHVGTSTWQVIPADPKVQRRKSRNRFKVVAKSAGKGMSTLQIFREEESWFNSKWTGRVMKGRMGIYEYNVLEMLNPAKAKEIDTAAAAAK
jgi:hypothetical protein